jgi:acetyl esterase/lipase
MDTSGTIAQLGRALGPDVLAAVRALYDDEQQALAAAHPATASDVAYGEHPRHRLDLYTPESAAGAAPVVVFVHGGGFLKGDKGGSGGGGVEAWTNANVGRMAAAAGMLGVVINYRLAPDDVWPAGAEDVAAAVAWVRANAADHGGDPSRIVLIGTSAGAVHVAGWLKLVGEAAARRDVRAAVLLSGLYGYTPLDPRDELYYGEVALYPERMPLEAVAATALPLLVACAQYDPPRFQAEFLGLLRDRLARHGALPAALIQNDHNHYSMTMHLGTADRRLSDAICAFVRDTTR